MKRKYKELSWLLGISLIIMLVLSYLFRDELSLILMGLLIALASAMICWNLALKIKSNRIIAYLIGFITGILGLLFYLIYYFFESRGIRKEEEEINKEKEKLKIP